MITREEIDAQLKQIAELGENFQALLAENWVQEELNKKKLHFLNQQNIQLLYQLRNNPIAFETDFNKRDFKNKIFVFLDDYNRILQEIQNIQQQIIKTLRAHSQKQKSLNKLSEELQVACRIHSINTQQPASVSNKGKASSL